MESNKDEAIRCIDIALDYRDKQNMPQAFKFIEKSIRLYPTQKAEQLLQRWKSEQNQQQHQQHQHDGGSTSQSPPPQEQHKSRTATPADDSPNQNRTYTKEQHEAVIRIKRCKDYYAVLEIARDANESVVKKAYRKVLDCVCQCRVC